MPAWGWFLLGIATAAVALIIIWAVFFRGSTLVDQVALFKSEQKRLEDQATAERLAKEKAEKLAADLELEIRNIAAAKKRRIDEIDDKKKSELRDLLTDPDSILDRVDAILRRAGSTPTE